MFLLLATLDLGPWDLVRVDVPDYPGADATSERGSVLLAPPDDVPWRVEPVPEVDGFVAEEAIEAMDVAPWHQAGFTGQGVKIAVFDLQWYGVDLRELPGGELDGVQTHDCYSHRSCAQPIDGLNPRFSWETGSHGVACAEVIADVAPGAELHLVRVNGQTSLENAVDWAVREGVDLVSMSLSYFNESFYDGTGSINALMDELAAGGVLMVTSAGNYARQHWQEEFHDTDGDGLHEFPWGSETLPIWFDSAGSHRVNFAWDDYQSCGATDLDVYVYDGDGLLVGRSTDTQDPDASRCAPVERTVVHVSSPGWYYLAVYRAAGDPHVEFSVLATTGEVWHSMAEGSLSDPGTHPAVFTVGAVRADGYATNQAESFSSQGPTHAGLDKPDIAGPDGLSTSVYGPIGFYGTSASTPAVTAAIALLMSADPTLSAAEAAARLQHDAMRGDATWQQADPALGAGIARLPTPGPQTAACAASPSPAPPWWAGLLALVALRRRQRAPLHTA